MDFTINAPRGSAQQDLGQFWGRYFAEIPVCTHLACDRVALEIDPYFPYLDDRNRCDRHGKASFKPGIPALS